MRRNRAHLSISSAVLTSEVTGNGRLLACKWFVMSYCALLFQLSIHLYPTSHNSPLWGLDHLIWLDLVHFHYELGQYLDK